MENIEYVWYSSIKMARVWCEECKTKALVVKGSKLCCDKPLKKGRKLGKLKRESTGTKREPPSSAEKRFMLEVQENKCFYCAVPFNEPFLHPKINKLRYTNVCYDHFIPYSYSQDNRQINFVGACQICNGIKRNLVFDSREDAITYVKYRRKKKGYDKAFTEKTLP